MILVDTWSCISDVNLTRSIILCRISSTNIYQLISIYKGDDLGEITKKRRNR